MAFAQGSRSRLTYAKETTFGTAPASLTTLPKNGHTLDLTKTLIESAEIRSDREVAVERHGNRSVAGSVDVEFRADEYDELLEGALFNTFNSSNELTLGTSLQTFTLEDGALDIDQYRLFTGCGVNSFSLNVAPDEIVAASFGFIGRNMAISGTSQDATPTASAGNAVFDSFTGTISIDSSAVANVTSLALNVDNGLNQTFVIGSAITPMLEYGRGNVTGELTAYFEDAALINYFLNETEIDLEFSLTDGVSGNTYTFELPRTKVNGAAVPLDNEQSRLITIPFRALYSTSDTYSIKITKS